MNNRVKEIRKKIGLKQEDFAKKLDLKRSSLASIETGSVTLTDRNVKTICKEFNINEKWLRTGKGEMFNTLQEDKELLNFIINVLSNKNEFIKDTFLTLARLDESEWAVIEKLINSLKNK